MRNIIKFLKNEDFKYITILILSVMIFMLPLLLQTEKIFRDDGAYQAYPKLIGAARYIQKGEIPLWNPDTFCGGKPFYTMYEGPIYNFLLYPFMFFADLNNMQVSFYILLIIPFLFCIITAGIGNYLFGRYILNLSYIPSFILGLFYALTPSLLISIISLHDTFAFAYIPWILFFSIKFLNTSNIKWWISGLISLILLSISNDINYIIRIYFFIVLASFIYSLFAMEKKIKSLAAFSCFICMILFSVGLTGIMWGGIIEGLSWIGHTGKISYEYIANEKMNFGNIISIFIPDFNGMIYGFNAWGESKRIGNSNYIFAGGIFISLLSFIAVLHLFINNKSKNNKNKLIWTWIGLIILIFTVLTMLGDRTPFFKIMCLILPWFFKIPYPHYYYFLQHWSIVLLAGLGASTLLNMSEIKNILKKYFIIIYLLIIIIFIVAAFLEPTEFDGEKISSIASLIKSGKIKWFLFEPASYFVISFLLLFIFIYHLKGKSYISLIIIMVFIEIIIFGYIVFYKGNISTNSPGDLEPNDECFEIRYANPDEQPYYEYLSKINEKITGDKRFTGTITYIDNFAWINGNRSLFGYDTKPMIKSLYDVMINFMEGYPYQMIPICYPKNFLKNMNVGYIIFKRFGVTQIKEAKSKFNNTEYDCIKIDEDLFDQNEDKVEIIELDEPLPYLYMQDIINPVEDNVQMEKLITDDLRKCAYINAQDFAPLKEVVERKIYENKNDHVENFNELQNINKIISTDRNNANKLIIKANIEKPCLLVRSEIFHKGWKVYINDKKTQLFRVNYLQQGVWLDKGEHEIIFKFFPDSIKFGLIITLFFTMMLIIILSVYFYIMKKK
ncbi:MAG: YfhO family protein [Spirochaetes bacterium]|nr:YfhO family protein [Spirochaetota bacterium]